MIEHKWDDDTETTYCTECNIPKRIYLILEKINMHLLRSEWDKASNAVYDLLECDNPLD